jgi:hypothetical protein
MTFEYRTRNTIQNFCRVPETLWTSPFICSPAVEKGEGGIDPCPPFLSWSCDITNPPGNLQACSSSCFTIHLLQEILSFKQLHRFIIVCEFLTLATAVYENALLISCVFFGTHFPVVPNWNMRPLSGFPWSHIYLDTRYDSPGRVRQFYT